MLERCCVLSGVKAEDIESFILHLIVYDTQHAAQPDELFALSIELLGL